MTRSLSPALSMSDVLGARAASRVTGYRAAIEATASVIRRRAHVYRNQTIVVGLVGCSVLAAAGFFRIELSILIVLLLPVCGAFLIADGRAVRRWEAELFAAWVKRDIDLVALCQAMRAHPALPSATLEGMLAVLPLAPSLVAEQAIQTPTRQAIAAVYLARNRRSLDRLLLKVTGAGLAGGVLIAAALTHRWAPLFGIGGLAGLPAIGWWRERQIVTAANAELAACQRDAAFSEADYVAIAGALE